MTTPSSNKALKRVVFGVGWIIFLYFMNSIFAKEDADLSSYHFSHERVDGASKFRLLGPDGSPVSYSTALDLLEARDSSFREMLSEVLQEQQRVVPAFFWECPSFSSTTLNYVPFEFVILPAPVLLTRHPDKHSFKEKFIEGAKTAAMAVSFPSLGGDAMLIAPVPQVGVDDEAYMHLAAFVHAAERQQVDALWQTVALTIRKQLATIPSEKKIWLSTSGAGVQWLHVRLDSRPKYYNWQEYM